ncbi:MAG: hypothetical protein ACT4PZ_10335 [Panacagrimonas sp.]
MPLSSLLSQPLQFPCGAMLPNRIAKAATTEGVADQHLRATKRFIAAESGRRCRHSNLFRLADGLAPALKRGPLSAFFAYMGTEYAAAFRVHRARRRHG